MANQKELWEELQDLVPWKGEVKNLIY